MSRYLLINLLIVLFPFLLSFEGKIKFYTKFKYYIFSVLTVSPIFIIWDSIATNRGDWGFSSEYLLGFHLIGLPIEEILFFVTVPFSAIFIYETVKLYIPDKKVHFNKNIYLVIGTVLLFIATKFNNQYYTSTVMVFSAIFIFLSASFKPAILQSRVYWVSISISFIPFLIVNYLLTALPIVWYSPEAIWGYRFITIPIEDFFYSFSIISFWFFFYLLYKKEL
jgi:lycopene cyclase domain-containing protein